MENDRELEVADTIRPLNDIAPAGLVGNMPVTWGVIRTAISECLVVLLATGDPGVAQPGKPQGQGHPRLIFIVPQKRIQRGTIIVTAARQIMKPPTLVTVDTSKPVALLGGSQATHLDQARVSATLPRTRRDSTLGTDQGVHELKIQIVRVILPEVSPSGATLKWKQRNDEGVPQWASRVRLSEK